MHQCNLQYALENNDLIPHFLFWFDILDIFPIAPSVSYYSIIFIVKSESRTLRYVQCSQSSPILGCVLKMLPLYHPLRISKLGKTCATHSLSGSQTRRQMTKWLWIALHLLDPLCANIKFFRMIVVQQTSLKLSVYNVNHVVRIIKKNNLLHSQIIIEITEIKSQQSKLKWITRNKIIMNHYIPNIL